MIESSLEPQTAATQHPEIESFLLQNNVQGEYKCTIYKWHPDLNKYVYSNAFAKRTPEPEFVVRTYGPGEFKWVWSTAEKDEMTQKPKPNVEFTQAFAGQHWDDLHEDYLNEQEELRVKKNRKRLDRQRLEQSYGGGSVKTDSLEELKRLLELQRLIAPPPPPQNNDVLIALIQNMGKQSQGPSIVETLLVEMIRGKSQVEVAAASGAGRQNPEDLAMKMIGYYEKGADMKMSREAPPPSTFSEIMDVVKEVAPAVIEFLGKVPAPVRSTVADAAMATMKDGKKFKTQMNTMKENPEWMVNAVNEWDKAYGPKQVDMFLQAGGAARPQATMDNYSKYPDKTPEEKPAEDVVATEVTTEPAQEPVPA